MRARDKIRQYDLAADEMNAKIQEILDAAGDIDSRYQSGSEDFTPNKVVKGKIVDIRNDEVIVDIGYKSEGVISINEFDDITSTTWATSSRSSSRASTKAAGVSC